MSETVATVQQKSSMRVFERLLTLWVALCIVAGVVLGQLMPAVFHVIGNATLAQVNIPVAVPWNTLILSVVPYIVVPVIAAQP